MYSTPSGLLEADFRWFLSFQYILAYRISGGTLVNFVAFVSRHHLENTVFNGPWMSMVEPSAFAPLFAHWEPEVQALIAVSNVSNSNDIQDISY